MNKRKRSSDDIPIMSKKQKLNSIELSHDEYEIIIGYLNSEDLLNFRPVSKEFNYLVAREIGKRENTQVNKFKRNLTRSLITIIIGLIKVRTKMDFPLPIKRVHELIEMCLCLRCDLDAIYCAFRFSTQDTLFNLICKHAKYLDTYKYIQRFIDAGCTLNIKGQKKTLLETIINVKHYMIEVVKLLLVNGADPNIQNFSGNTPLMELGYYTETDNDIWIMKTLLDAGANPNIFNKNEDSALHIFIKSGNNKKYLKEKISLLLQAGARVNQRDSYGNTPLLSLVLTNSLTPKIRDVADLLISFGADPVMRNMKAQCAEMFLDSSLYAVSD